jgi:integrase
VRGSIKQRGKKTWRVRIYLGRDGDGKQKVHSETIHGKREDAEAYATLKIHKIQFGGEVPRARDARFKTILDKWWETKQATISASSRDVYEKELRLYVRPHFEQKRLRAITADSLQEFYNRQLAAGWRPWLVRRVHLHVRSILDLAVRARLITFNPAADRTIKLPPAERRNYVVFDREQARDFAAALSAHPERALFLLALETGLRPGELVALTWRDLNLQAGTITVQRRVYYKRKSGWIFEEQTKTASSRRQLPLSSVVLDALRAQAERVKGMRASVPDWYEHGLIFPSRTGWPQHSRNIGRLVFKPLLRAAGLDERMRLYELRHTVATLLLDAAENVKVVQERLGHARASTTLDTYGHVLPGRQQQATATLSDILHGQVA